MLEALLGMEAPISSSVEEDDNISTKMKKISKTGIQDDSETATEELSFSDDTDENDTPLIVVTRNHAAAVSG